MPSWYNVKTHAVGSGEERGDPQDLLGLFATIEKAQSALMSAHERNDDADRDEVDGKGEVGDDECQSSANATGQRIVSGKLAQ